MIKTHNICTSCNGTGVDQTLKGIFALVAAVKDVERPCKKCKGTGIRRVLNAKRF